MKRMVRITMQKDKFIELYSEFRKELDKMCIPLIYDNLTKRAFLIKAEGKVVGIISGAVDYIDCVYVLPEYRRRGLAKKAVMDFVDGYLHYGIRLHIINNNEVALKFWNSLFELQKIGSNEIDTLYEIVKVRK